MREIGGQVVGDSVGEIVLLLVAGKVLERQHDDRQTRRVRELVVNGNGHETRGASLLAKRSPRREKHERKRRGKHWPARPDAARFGRVRRKKSPRPAAMLSALTAAIAAGVQSIGPHRVGDIFQALLAKVDEFGLDPPARLPIGVLGKADRARIANPFEARGDVDPVAQDVLAVDENVAEIDPDAIENEFALGTASLRSAIIFWMRMALSTAATTEGNSSTRRPRSS